MGDPKVTIGFNIKLWSNDLDDLGYPFQDISRNQHITVMCIYGSWVKTKSPGYHNPTVWNPILTHAGSEAACFAPMKLALEAWSEKGNGSALICD